MYDSIIVPIDGSDPAQAAAETAVQLADTLDAEVSLLAVLEPSNRALTEPLPDDPDRDDLGSQWRGGLDQAADAAATAGVSCQTAIESGAAHEAIEEYVDRIDADLVSMGTHGRSGLNRLLMGSVTERALRTLDVPVLAVPGAETVADFDDIVVPTGGSPGSERAAEHACALANAYDATVHPIAVVDVQSLAAAGGAAIPEVIDSLEAQRENDVETVREIGADNGLDVESKVIEGAPRKVILEYADEQDADLVTMGTHGREGTKRFILGSVTEGTIREGEFPVLATPLAT